MKKATDCVSDETKKMVERIANDNPNDAYSLTELGAAYYHDGIVKGAINAILGFAVVGGLVIYAGIKRMGNPEKKFGNEKREKKMGKFTEKWNEEVLETD